jgi:methionine synthase I (cobalamin-dependent)
MRMSPSIQPENAVHPTIARLLENGPVVTDGAWATQLQQLGLAPGDCPDAWNLTRPAAVEQVAASYVAAGSGVILTNTFGANRIRLGRHALGDRAATINRAGVEISLRAAAEGKRGRGAEGAIRLPTSSGESPPRPLSPSPPLVFASMGPSGQLLAMGQTTEAELRAVFVEQAAALKDGGAEGIVIETMSDLAEAVLAVAAARETGLPVVACMTFDFGPQKDRTMMGVTPEQAAERLAAAEADAVGANCGHGIAGMVEVCRRMHAATDRPIWIKANAGLPEVVEGRVVYRQTPYEFASYVPRLVESGASLVGGCCGTTPEFIRAVAEVIKKRYNDG